MPQDRRTIAHDWFERVYTGMTILRVRNGQIIEAWNNFDFATMTAQLTAARP